VTARFVSFFVPGVPETKGSWISLGKGRVKADNPREKGWANAVGWMAKTAMALHKRQVTGKPVEVNITFWLPPRPNKSRKNQRDLDKLCRSALDSMTGLVYADDEQVFDLTTKKRVRRRNTGADIQVWELPFEVCSVDEDDGA
jgi:Holliday junction resolvase RusA-like endonuclease